MRIGIDASKMMPPRDGIGTYVASIVRALVASTTDHEFLLYPTLHAIDPQVIEQTFGVRPDHVRVMPHRAPRTGDVDIFHATSWLRPAGFDGPVLMTCYDTTVLSHPEAHELANRVHCLRGLLDSRLHGDTFLTLSAATAQDLLHWFEVPTQANGTQANGTLAIETVPAAVDARFAAPPADEQEATLERFGLKAPYVLAVGTLEPRKNLRRLLGAWQRLDEATRTATPLVVVGGSGWGDPSLTHALETTPGVRLLGYVDDEALPALYAAASVFAYPSLAEGFGFPVLEAMACGTAVITSNRSSLEEVAGDAAVLVDPEDESSIADALARLLTDADLRTERAAASVARAADFSWKQTADALLGVYSRVAATALRAEAG